MTRKHYRAIAEVIDRVRRDHPEATSALWDVVHGLEYALRQDNPRFDRERFRAACFKE